MSDRLVLHIGTHKTGTTAIQGVFGINQKALKAQGYDYPILSTHFPHVPNNRNGYFIGREVRNILKPGATEETALAKAQACRKELAAYVETPEDIILSDERLWWTAAQDAKFVPALREYLEEIGFKRFSLIVYLRRQDQFVEALWNQFVKGDTRLTTPLTEYIELKSVRRTCDYAKGLDRFSDVFGKENITVRIFDRSQLKDGDVVPDFAHALGLDTAAFTWPEGDEANTRLSNDMVEIKRIMNGVKGYCESGNFMRETALNISNEHKESNKTNMLPAANRKAFLARYEQGNEYVAREYLGFEDGVLFGPAKSDAYPDWTPDSDSMREALALTFDVLLNMHPKSKNSILEREQAKKAAAVRAAATPLSTKVKREIKRRISSSN